MAPALSFAADSEFFVEIGDDVKKDEAPAHWSELVAKHKTLLGKLKMYPKDVMQNGQSLTTRMQAGPIASKVAALKVCNKLFAADVPCFVIEGVNDAPPTAMMHLNDTNNTKVASGGGGLPWLSPSAGAREISAPTPIKGEDTAIDGSQRLGSTELPTKNSAPKTDVKGEVKLPWLMEKKAEEAKKAQEEEDKADAADADKAEKDAEVAANAKKRAQVQVAEAIRVPLTQTDNLEDQIRVSALPELKPSFGMRQLRDETTELGNVNSGAGWLSVGNFVNEEIASSMWEEVRNANRKQAKSLNMKIERPAVASDNDQITLSVGPFANSAEALNFCRGGLQAGERGLHCGFVANDAGIANGKLLALNAHSDAYAERSARQRPRENPPVEASAASVAKLSPASGPSKQYWVQVVTADSQMQALKQWEQVKSGNKEVIGNLRSSVSASATDKNSYVVRVGPIAENDQAIRVCSQLQKRNVECRVLLYSQGNI